MGEVPLYAVSGERRSKHIHSSQARGVSTRNNTRTVLTTINRGTSLLRNSPPPSGHHRALDIVLL